MDENKLTPTEQEGSNEDTPNEQEQLVEVELYGQKVYVTKGVDLQSLINEQIEQEVSNKATGFTPRRNMSDPLLQRKKEFEEMSYTERLNLYNEDIDLYNELVK